MANVNLFALGGQDENGKNSFVLEIDNKIFVIDFGTKIPIVSKLGVDTIIPNFEYLKKNVNKVKGIFITHGHDESFAALPFLLMSVKGLTIYATNFTTQIIKDRISKYKIGHRDYKIVVLKDEQTIDNVKIKVFNLAHSIPGTIGLDFNTNDGSIIFMSNFVIGDLGIYGKTDLQSIKENASDKGILALILETSKVSFVGSAIDKSSVKHIIEKIFAKVQDNNRIIIGAYNENMYTLQEVLDLAIKTGRPIIPYGREYSNLLKLYTELNPKVKMPKIIDYKMIKKIPNAIVLITGVGERLYKRFIRISEQKDVFMKLKKEDTIIMIAPPINGLEKTAAMTLDLISRNSQKVYDISERDYYTLNPTHDDVEEVITTLKPRNVVPIMGYYRYMTSAKRLIEDVYKKTRTIILLNGIIAFFKDGKLVSANGKIKEVGDTIVDGLGVGDLSYGVIAERAELSRNGIITIAIVISYKTKKMITNPKIQINGMMIPTNGLNIIDLITSKVKQIITENEGEDFRVIQNKIKNKIRKTLFRKINKEPMVIITFYKV